MIKEFGNVVNHGGESAVASMRNLHFVMVGLLIILIIRLNAIRQGDLLEFCKKYFKMYLRRARASLGKRFINHKKVLKDVE